MRVGALWRMSLCEYLPYPGLSWTKTKPFLVVVESLSWWSTLYYSKGSSYCKPVHRCATHCSTGILYFFFLTPVASISTLIAPTPIIITCKESRKRLPLSSGLRMKTEKTDRISLLQLSHQCKWEAEGIAPNYPINLKGEIICFPLAETLNKE